MHAKATGVSAGGKWVGEEFFPNDPQRETAQGEVFGYVFNDISGAEHFHRGKNVPSLAQSNIRALYTSPPTRAPGIEELSIANTRGDAWRDKFNTDTDVIAGLCRAAKAFIEWDDRERDHTVYFNARITLYDTAINATRAALIDAGVRVEVRK